MPLNAQYSLDELSRAYAQAAEGDTPSPAGLRAVLAAITDAARTAIAHDPERYDHRSLYEFAAALDYASKQPNSEQLG